MRNKPLSMFRIGVAIIAISLFVFPGLLPVSAATTASVNATVTAQNISLSVSSGTVSYGTLALNTSANTSTAELNQTQTVTNTGNIAEDFEIKGQNTAAWTLAATSGTDTYTHKFCISTCTTPDVNYTALTTSYQTLATNISSSGTQNVDLQITTPVSTETFTEQTVSITILASAH